MKHTDDNERQMQEQKKTMMQTLVIIFLLILTLPLFYLLFAKVLLPLEWKENASADTTSFQYSWTSLRSDAESSRSSG
jgi:hypothetical protein